jgi:hypothetical protein
LNVCALSVKVLIFMIVSFEEVTQSMLTAQNYMQTLCQLWVLMVIYMLCTMLFIREQ